MSRERTIRKDDTAAIVHGSYRRIVTGDLLTIRIRDDCRAFDPGKYMAQFSEKDPTRNVGLRMITAMAKEIIYQNNAGINTLLIKIDASKAESSPA